MGEPKAPTPHDIAAGVAFARRALEAIRDDEAEDLDGVAVAMALDDCAWPYGRDEAAIVWLLSATIAALEAKVHATARVRDDLAVRNAGLRVEADELSRANVDLIAELAAARNRIADLEAARQCATCALGEAVGDPIESDAEDTRP